MLSLLDLMCAVARTHASPRASSVMRVKKHASLLFLTLIVRDIETKKRKKEKQHQIQ